MEKSVEKGAVIKEYTKGSIERYTYTQTNTINVHEFLFSSLSAGYGPVHSDTFYSFV